MRTPTAIFRFYGFAGALLLAVTAGHADQIEMQNGDRYAGQVLSMTSNSIVLQSEVLGKVNVPRSKVLSVSFGAPAAITAPKPAASVTANATAVPHSPNATLSTTNADISGAFRSLGANTNFVQQVRQQMLAEANPAANQKFNETLDGLMSGKLNVNDIRSQAQSSIEQINKLKRELGPEADDALDSYLSILQNFVNDTSSVQPSAASHSSAPAPADSE